MKHIGNAVEGTNCMTGSLQSFTNVLGDALIFLKDTYNHLINFLQEFMPKIYQEKLCD
jgi:uncharacterized membrane protein YoaK (UPF0700 family)